jgi:hypothetical protein
MKAGGRRIEPGVDAAEQHLETRRDDVAQALAGRRFQIGFTGPA